ncbi:MAG: TRAP transporter substrate-binding protein [Proteobacteria bacterium]|nr:TRAP transporter substrate-binding protein [Pseudomonadota bacterium]
MKNLKIDEILSKNTLFFLFVLLAFGSIAQGKEIKLKMSHFMSSKHPMDKMVMRPWAETVKKETQEKVNIKMYVGGALGKPPAQYKSAVNGITDIAFGLQGYTPGRFPLTSVMELPFIVDDSAVSVRVLWELFQNGTINEYKDVHVLMLWLGDASVIMTSDKQIRAVGDVEGMVLRTPSANQANVIKQLGANPVKMPITEAYMATERKVIDGIMAPFSAVKSFKFHEVNNHYSNIKLARSVFFLVMNKRSWKKLTPENQQLFNRTTGLNASVRASNIYDKIGKKTEDFISKKGLTITSYSKSQTAEFRKKLQPVYTAWANKMEKRGLPGKKVLAEVQRLSALYSK